MREHQIDREAHLEALHHLVQPGTLHLGHLLDLALVGFKYPLRVDHQDEPVDRSVAAVFLEVFQQ